MGVATVEQWIGLPIHLNYIVKDTKRMQWLLQFHYIPMFMRLSHTKYNTKLSWKNHSYFETYTHSVD